ncbi:MAG: hypothetical protein H6645_04285 [Caldilineaceae bacterium]|nr:hypothetical protein [Caldilineaceae bacterium]
MYKLVLTHELLPGKLGEMKAWLKQSDERRKQADPSYTAIKRYITVYGSVHQITIELEMENTTDHPFVDGYAEMVGGAQDDYLKMIVPGSSELKILKEIDLS